MKKLMATGGILVSTLAIYSQQCTYVIDIQNIREDKIKIWLYPSHIAKKELIFYFPKIVPGTYNIYDFGQYVSAFRAYDKKGKELKVTHPDHNTWIIQEAENIDHLSYEVEDTWDAVNPTEIVFEPAGTNIEAGKNIVINPHGFFGYFEGYKEIPYTIVVKKPAGFYASTGIEKVVHGTQIDTLILNDYMELTDSPVMYCTPDTAWIQVANTKVLISTYHSSNEKISPSIASSINSMLQAQAHYLGGKLPVNKYAFIIYLSNGIGASGGAGALEHSTSSFYYLPMMPMDQLSKFIVDVAAHEFFHILTPLTIHSYEIGNFDYIHPKMSKHLWLYEGVTEYFAGHMQLYEGLITLDEYLQILRSKMLGNETFRQDISFTELSLHCLDQHKSQYLNVYQKGALIGLCLDILLRKESKGEKGLRDLMEQLSQIYGLHRSFHDDSLFDVIASLTYPSVRDFFRRYVEGTEPLPFKEYLSWIGIEYEPSVIVKEPLWGNPGLAYNPQTQRFTVIDLSNLDETGKKLKYKINDEIINLNGAELHLTNYQQKINEFKKNAREGESFYVTVLRKGKTKRLKARYLFKETEKKHFLTADERAESHKIYLRNKWMNKP